MVNQSNASGQKQGTGFTLIELLGIVTILGIVACIVLPRLRDRNAVQPVAPAPVIEPAEEQPQTPSVED